MAGILLTLLVLLLTTQDKGIHWARAEVRFSGPPALVGPDGEMAPGASVVPFAAAVQRSVASQDQHFFGSDEAPLYGVVTHGSSIRLADSGSQWVHVFDRPVLILEVVDADPVEVDRRMDELLQAVSDKADELQRQRPGADGSLITATLDDVERAYVAPSRSRLARAWVIIVGGGAAITLLALKASRPAPRGPYSRGRLTDP